MKKITLSSCRDDEYTCTDGSCINLTQRCDLRVDCLDSSDEVGCEKLVLPTEYMIDLSPPGLSSVMPLQVNFSLILNKILEVSIVNFNSFHFD